jgi:hypothetical protein
VGRFRRAHIVAVTATTATLYLLTGTTAAITQVRNLDKPGAFAIEGGLSGISLEKRGRVEQQTANGWRPVFEEFYLAKDCSAVATLPACVRLAPGDTLRPVRWTGFTCSGQCPRPCKRNIYRPPGTFRLTLTMCTGAKVSSGPFYMGAEGKQ